MKLMLILSLYCFSLLGLAQNGKVQGVIRNGISSESSPYIHILLRGALEKGFFLETNSDSLGKFEFHDLPQGEYEINFNLIGYNPYKLSNVTVSNDSITFLSIKFPCPDGSRQSKKICPIGHTDEIIPILYGLPSEKAIKKADKGKIYLGGCIITECSPSWYCKKHKLTF